MKLFSKEEKWEAEKDSIKRKVCYNFFVRSRFYIPTSDCFWWPFSTNRVYQSPERNQSSSLRWTLEISVVYLWWNLNEKLMHGVVFA